MTRALIIGRAKGVWGEIEAAFNLCQFDVVIAVGQVAVDYSGPIDHWASYHPQNFTDWKEKRRRKGYPDPIQQWTGAYEGGQKEFPLADTGIKTVKCSGGSSGLLAAVVALNLYGDELRGVLAGIPLDPSRGHYDLRGPWNDGKHYPKHWEARLLSIQGRVKSMSGWTATLLGKPTTEWLYGNATS